ncbi:hypothetical protein [Photobacterium sanguinicancri]|nr:hypothetical protein [Photobacterium sanguinicancri]MDO6499261.1 hypothetical protein [Photobacterium sanguinicancri]
MYLTPDAQISAHNKGIKYHLLTLGIFSLKLDSVFTTALALDH